MSSGRRVFQRRSAGRNNLQRSIRVSLSSLTQGRVAVVFSAGTEIRNSFLHTYRTHFMLSAPGVRGCSRRRRRLTRLWCENWRLLYYLVDISRFYEGAQGIPESSDRVVK